MTDTEKLKELADRIDPRKALGELLNVRMPTGYTLNTVTQWNPAKADLIAAADYLRSLPTAPAMSPEQVAEACPAFRTLCSKMADKGDAPIVLSWADARGIIEFVRRLTLPTAPDAKRAAEEIDELCRNHAFRAWGVRGVTWTRQTNRIAAIITRHCGDGYRRGLEAAARVCERGAAYYDEMSRTRTGMDEDHADALAEEHRSDADAIRALLPPSPEADVEKVAEEPRYAGYTMREACEAAIANGTLDGWEWLQAWWKADLEPDDEKCPGHWTA